MPDDTHIGLRERVAALEQMLVGRTAERDAAPLQAVHADATALMDRRRDIMIHFKLRTYADGPQTGRNQSEDHGWKAGDPRDANSSRAYSA